MREQFVALFGRRIQGHRIVHLVVGAVRHLLVRAVHAGRTGIHQMFHRVLSARFQHVIKADNIALDVHVRIGDGIPHARLRRQVDDDIEFILVEKLLNERLVRKVTFDKNPLAVRFIRKLFDLREAVLFERNVVVVVHIVEPDEPNVLARAQQFHREIAPDEPRRPGHKDGFIIQNFIHLNNSSAFAKSSWLSISNQRPTRGQALNSTSLKISFKATSLHFFNSFFLLIYSSHLL